MPEQMNPQRIQQGGVQPQTGTSPVGAQPRPIQQPTAPAQQVPAQQQPTPVQPATPAEQAPMQQQPTPVQPATPAEQAPMQQQPIPEQQPIAPAEQAPVQQQPTPAQQVPAQQQPTPVQPATPAEQAPVQQQPTPAQQPTAPAQQAPVQQQTTPAQQSVAPAQQAPVQQQTTPAQQSVAPAQQAPVQKQPTPVQRPAAPVKQAPEQQQPTPVQQPVAPAQQAPVQQQTTPAQQSVAPAEPVQPTTTGEQATTMQTIAQAPTYPQQYPPYGHSAYTQPQYPGYPPYPPQPYGQPQQPYPPQYATTPQQAYGYEQQAYGMPQQTYYGQPYYPQQAQTPNYMQQQAFGQQPQSYAAPSFFSAPVPETEVQEPTPAAPEKQQYTYDGASPLQDKLNFTAPSVDPWTASAAQSTKNTDVPKKGKRKLNLFTKFLVFVQLAVVLFVFWNEFNRNWGGIDQFKLMLENMADYFSGAELPLMVCYAAMLLSVVFVAFGLLAVLFSAKHAGGICRAGNRLLLIEMTLYPIVLAVSLVAALQGASFPNALLNFVNSETSLDTLKEIYLSKKAYLALHESIPAKMTFGGALLLLFGMLVFNRIVFFFANRPLRRAKKAAKKAKKNQ